jgi:hypothetical protein
MKGRTPLRVLLYGVVQTTETRRRRKASVKTTVVYVSPEWLLLGNVINAVYLSSAGGFTFIALSCYSLEHY